MAGVKLPGNVRLRRTKERYPQGVVVGSTNLDEADFESLAAASEIEAVVGTYAGEADLSTDVAALQATIDTETTGLVDRVEALETTAAVEVTEVPAAPIVASNNVRAYVFSIVDGGAANTIDFTLPQNAPVGSVFSCIVDLTADEDAKCEIDITYGEDEVLEDAANAIYIFHCLSPGGWICLNTVFAAHA